jgi:hypothetical protein
VTIPKPSQRYHPTYPPIVAPARVQSLFTLPTWTRAARNAISNRNPSRARP